MDQMILTVKRLTEGGARRVDFLIGPSTPPSFSSRPPTLAEVELA